MNIRETTGSDLPGILDVVTRAFGREKSPEIAGLVKGLLEDPGAKPILSLLAKDSGSAAALGHILFTTVRIGGFEEAVSASILAPLSVVPDAQSRGIGGRLIQEGARRLAASGVELVFVLGHPGYYPRHGFAPVGALGFEAPYPIPAEHADAWMIRELRPGAAARARGRVRCADALHRPEHWRE